MEKNELEFKIGAFLKNIIGKDLITDDFIAIFELVKNSYDAHATKVVISFEEDKIIITDNGKGMSLEDVKNKWLFVAYSAKSDGSEDREDELSFRDKIKVRKHYAGAKGIGRFSCDRLGKKLRIETKKIDSDSTIILDVNWQDFEDDPKKEFQNVKLNYILEKSPRKTFTDNFNHGTKLTITNLNGNWTRKKLLDLKHSLEKLINPFSETDDFSIIIECPREIKEDNEGRYKDNLHGTNLYRKGTKYIERDKVNGEVTNSLLNVLKLKTTHINIIVKNGKILSKLSDRGSLIYEIKELNSKYELITDLKMDLYFLNTIAKTNFTRQMGVQVVNFGSVFLFKNGFRVQPYGNVGDDSWGLDYRAQQGHNRFLGTRDVFGRVDITTDNINEFAEVTSRDGGLVETEGYHQLMDIFNEKALKYLERYVVGVLWGEGFRRNKYFGIDESGIKKVNKYRKQLKEDKMSDNFNIAKSNLGSKLDFIRIIKGLSSNNDIEIVYYNKEFIDLVNDKIDDISTNIIGDLKQIAENTNDKETWNKIERLEAKYDEMKKQKEMSERKAKEEERKRKEAEKRFQKEKDKREKAEEEGRKERERRQKAENDRLRAENDKLKAEKQAREEKEKKEKAEEEVKKRKEQVSRYKATKSIEYKDLEKSNHIIGVYAATINEMIKQFKYEVNQTPNLEKDEIFSFLQGISLATDSILTVTRFTTKSNYLVATLKTEEDIVSYISDYVTNTLKMFYKDIDFILNTRGITFNCKFKPIELCTALDNITSNSDRKKASKIIYSFSIVNDCLVIAISDVGAKLSPKIKDWNLIFEEGVTTTQGAGLGLANVKDIVENDLNGNITYNPNYTKGFELIITLKGNKK